MKKLVFLLLLVFISGCTINTPYGNYTINTGSDSNETQIEDNVEVGIEEDEVIEPTPEQDSTSSANIALFFTDTISSQEEYLGDINWDSSYRAIFKYLPELNTVEVMDTASSTSYSSNVIYPMTIGERFFVIRDWGSDWTSDNTRWDITEFNPVTGDQIIDHSNLNAGGFTIIQNTIYYSSPTITDFYGTVTGGGDLMKVDLGSYSATTVIDLEPGEVGKLFNVGGELVSVLSDYTGDIVTMDVRIVDVNAGTMTDLFTGIETDSSGSGNMFRGEYGLYHVIEVSGIVYIDHYGLNGGITELLNLELETGDNRIFVTESNDILAIFTQSTSFDIIDLILFDLNTGELTSVEFASFDSLGSFSRVGIPFLYFE